MLAELAGVGGYAWEVGKGGARWTLDISRRKSNERCVAAEILSHADVERQEDW